MNFGRTIPHKSSAVTGGMAGREATAAQSRAFEAGRARQCQNGTSSYLQTLKPARSVTSKAALDKEMVVSKTLLKKLWTHCDNCGEILYIKDLKKNYNVCTKCGHHLQVKAPDRISQLIDEGTWRPLWEMMSPDDPLKFNDEKGYSDRLKIAQDKTGMQDAVHVGTGLMGGIPVAFGVMDFRFMGGSMGSVVGEKITRLIEYATEKGLALILVCASGGARMQEGVLSLMQMAKISAALHVYGTSSNGVYIAVLTSPTTGGVTASFAMLGDVIIAEPKALIGFAGQRVIEQTIGKKLPADFQEAEQLFARGALDLIIERPYLKPAMVELLTLYKQSKPLELP